MTDLLPGDVFFTNISGKLGEFIGFGQWVIDHEEWKERSPYSHVGIVIESDEVWETALILEAMPKGARLRQVGFTTTEHKFVRLELTDLQRRQIASIGPVYEGVRYGFSDYLALATKHLGINWKWLDRYIANNGRMICSQLVDHLLMKVGYHVFDDGRLSQDVTPGDLWFALRRQGTVLE